MDAHRRGLERWQNLRKHLPVLLLPLALAATPFRAVRGANLCEGDCDGNRAVEINELVLAVNVALGSAAGGACPAVDADLDGEVRIDELVGAVRAALSGCGGGASCVERPDPHCSQPLNAILIPRLRALGHEPRDAEPEELCRRLAVDLLGRIPTEAELDECVGRPLDERVSTWMQRPEYEENQKRFWSSELGFDIGRTQWWQVFDLDELVAQMVRGEVSYADFAARAVVHPAFFVSRADDGWGAGVFNVFLGRPARRDEMDGTRPLAAMFFAREVCDGRAAELVYLGCLAEQAAGQLEEGVVCRRGCLFETYEGGVDPCGCTPRDYVPMLGTAFFGCTGSGFGELVDLGVTRCPAREQLQRLIDETAGAADRCVEPEATCVDLAIEYEPDVRIRSGPPAVPLPAASPALHTNLAQIGAALARRGDFWEAAVDRELRRLLGWWQSSFRQPDHDLPEVRSYLTRHLRETGDLRSVQHLIFTSLLYTAPAAVPEGLEGEPPPWCSAPRKALVAESWLESAEVAAGEKLGLCDYRFIAREPQQATFMIGATGQARHLDSTLDFATVFPNNPELARRLNEVVTFRSLAGSLEGCGFDPRPRSANLSIVSVQGEIATLLCALGRDVVPAGIGTGAVSDDALRGAARHLLRRTLSRSGSDEAIDGLVEEMRACIDEGECANGSSAVRWLCARLVDSTAFALY